MHRNRSLIVACTLALMAGVAQAGPEGQHWGTPVHGKVGFTIDGNRGYVAVGSPHYGYSQRVYHHAPVYHVVHHYPPPYRSHSSTRYLPHHPHRHYDPRRHHHYRASPYQVYEGRHHQHRDVLPRRHYDRDDD
ncbi:MAG TPA: hypothetical protein VL027_01605 [Spongiibacteraceae bacterium]|jgi:hypothetical protein|nr:hypothetical protein [Spongiibacteraceae bacterium]HUH36617.1 hypothetical protein [Spongiibacteraceae bacterium]